MTKLTKCSIEDYHHLIETGMIANRSVELIAGEIIKMSPESPLHTVYGEGFANYLRNRLQGRAWIREAHPITLADSEPEPDIAIVKLPWFQYSDHHPYPADIFWLIEVSDSTLGKDLNDKKRIYALAGIAEYWVIDVKAKKVIIFRHPSQGTYSIKLEFSQGKIASIPFPDVEIPIEKLFTGDIFGH